MIEDGLMKATLNVACDKYRLLIIVTLGVNRHAMHTRADKLIVTDMDVILSGT